MRKLSWLLLLLVIAVVLPDVGQAAAPQTIGTYDTIESSLTSAECLQCHSAGGVGTAARHHLLTVTGASCGTCHYPVTDPATGAVTTLITGDCAKCHGTKPAHHYQTTGCSRCHGSIVNEPDDGHYISDKPFEATTPLIFEETQGYCGYCHKADSTAAIPVFSPMVTHHTFTGKQSPPCGICHDVYNMTGTATRYCQRCHGVDNLHNIQGDGDGNGVVAVLGEGPGRGHAGDAADCRGCHTLDMTLPVALGNVIPSITGVDVAVLKANTKTPVTIFGRGFRSVDVGGTASPAPVVVVSGASGAVLAPVFAGDNLTVTIPPLQAGNYTLHVEKESKRSNPIALAVVPAAVISSATVSGDVLSITGSGFGAEDALLLAKNPVTIDGVPCTVLSWSDTLIKAAAPAALPGGSVIRITTLFDTAAYSSAVLSQPEITAAIWEKGLITVNGANFGQQLPASTISVGGSPCSIVSWTDGMVVAKTSVQPAETATVVISTNGMTVSAPVVVHKVTILSAEWLNGTLTVSGTGFGTAGSITVNGVPVVITSWSDTTVTAAIAQPKDGAAIAITAAYGSATSSVVVKAVKIAVVEWSKGVLTISGSGFGRSGYAGNHVYLNDKIVPIVSWTTSTITVAQKSSPQNGSIIKVEAEYGVATAQTRKK